jgi:hypothetical protein
MNEYRIYKHPNNEIKAIKDGWSWPGAVLVGFRVLYKKLWIPASVALIISLVLHGPLPFTNVPFLFDLACSIAFGYFGNSWRESILGDRGYERVGSVEAKTPDRAIADYLRGLTAAPNAGERIEPTFNIRE